MPGVLRTRSLACRMEEAYEHSHHRFAEITPALPAQWVYGLLRALPGEPGFFATVACGLITRKLDPSVGGSGPHGLTVRIDIARLRQQRVHRIPPSTFVTIATRPPVSAGRGG